MLIKYIKEQLDELELLIDKQEVEMNKIKENGLPPETCTKEQTVVIVQAYQDEIDKQKVMVNKLKNMNMELA